MGSMQARYRVQVGSQSTRSRSVAAHPPDASPAMAQPKTWMHCQRPACDEYAHALIPAVVGQSPSLVHGSDAVWQ